MTRAGTMLSAVAMAAWLVGCGGGSKSAPGAEEPESAAEDVGVESSANAKLEGLCRTLCKRVADICDEEPLAEFDAEACPEACIDETDGVIEDVGRCLDAAGSCAEAVECREQFGD